LSLEQLQTFEPTGETAYVSKHNANVGILQNLLQILFDRTASLALTNATIGTDAMFGNETAFIGADSYAAEIEGGDPTHLLVGSGYCYRYSRHQAVSSAAPVTLDFAGQTSGLYYIRATSAGVPEFTADATDALWSVSWNGTALSSVTRIARIVWGAEDWVAAQSSAKFDGTFVRLADRLAVIEGYFRNSPSFQLLGTQPTSGQVLLRYIATERMTIPAAMAGSFFRLEVPPADGEWELVVAIKPLGGVPGDVGSATHQIGETEASTLSLPGGDILEPGDELIITAPTVVDSEASGPYGSVKAER
jgi:hypothetical protein